MSTWKGFSQKLKWSMAMFSLVIAIIAGVSVFQYLAGEEAAQAGERSLADVRLERIKAMEAKREERRARLAQIQKESAEREKRYEEERAQREAEYAKFLEDLKNRPKKQTRPRRKVRRWKWMSPPEKVAQAWNVPKSESQKAAITGLLRICTSEQEGSEEDCIGIYQVLTNIRSRSCNRDYFRLITECDDEGETLLSAMRRASRYVVGVVPARYARQRWISQLETDCNMPKSYPQTVKRYCRRGNLKQCASDFWEKRHRHHCEATTELATGLIGGTNKRRITSARIIAWGGRCEEPRGACDDPIGCQQGYARVPHIERMKSRSLGGKQPANAFWCKISSPGCRTDTDPICVAMGYGDNDKLPTKEKVLEAINRIKGEKAKLETKETSEEVKKVLVVNKS